MCHVLASTRSLVASDGLTRPPLVGAILSGGASRRYGADKAARIGPIVLDAMRGAGIDPVFAVGGHTDTLLIPTLPDRYPGEGPLGGVATALTYARTGWVLVVPCDHPRLEAQHLVPFLTAMSGLEAGTSLVATVNGEPRHQIGCWPAAIARTVNDQVRQGERRFRTMLDLAPWVGVPIHPLALADADTPDQLDALLATDAHTTEPPTA